MNLNVCKLEMLDIKISKARNSEKIRGYLGNKYYDMNILHNHKEDNFIYGYPKVQYKIIDKEPIIIGIEEGSRIVANIGIQEDELIIDNKVMNIFEKKITIEKCDFGVSDDYIAYEFLLPWIALNQKNISDYLKANEMKREEILQKILIGNIISMSKGFNYTVENKIKCWINLQQKTVSIKNIKHIAFVGEFKVNFNIPDYFGIGKNVSKGFGTIKKKR